MSMFFTRYDKTLRVWFAAVTNAGAYRTGLTQASFTVNVVNPTDSAQVTSLVSESTQRPGVYYFDVPSSFLTTYGVGDYMVGVKIDSQSGSAGAPQVKSVESNVIHVTHDDFDSISGSVWNSPNGAFNTTGTMGGLLNLVSQISGNTTATAIASAVWNAVTTTYNTSGSFGQIVNNIFISQSSDFQNIVSGVWNANASTFNTVGTLGYNVNQTLSEVTFILSSTFLASGSITSTAGGYSWIATTVTGNVNQYNGMLLLVKTAASGSQTRIIDTFRTGTFDIDPPLTFATASDGVYVVMTQFVPGYGNIH